MTGIDIGSLGLSGRDHASSAVFVGFAGLMMFWVGYSERRLKPNTSIWAAAIVSVIYGEVLSLGILTIMLGSAFAHSAS
jgi:hypothetical protein